MAGRGLRSARLAFGFTLLAAVLLYVVWWTDEFVPVGWRGTVGAGLPRIGVRGGLPVPITTTGTLLSGEPYTMTVNVSAGVRGWFVMTGVELKVTPMVCTISNALATPEQQERVVREAGLDTLKTQLTGLVGFGPGVSGVIDRAFATPNVVVTQTFGDRAWADWLLIVRAVLLCVCWLALIGAAGWLCVRVTVAAMEAWAAKRKGCVACGYSRAGLPESEPCPECGLQPPRAGEFYGGRLAQKVKRPAG